MKHPIIFNLELTTADTEYSIPLTARNRKLFFKCREDVDIRYAYKKDFVAIPIAPYMTLEEGNSRQVDVDGALSVYFACSKPGVTMEVEIWSA